MHDQVLKIGIGRGVDSIHLLRVWMQVGSSGFGNENSSSATADGKLETGITAANIVPNQTAGHCRHAGLLQVRHVSCWGTRRHGAGKTVWYHQSCKRVFDLSQTLVQNKTHTSSMVSGERLLHRTGSPVPCRLDLGGVCVCVVGVCVYLVRLCFSPICAHVRIRMRYIPFC